MREIYVDTTKRLYAELTAIKNKGTDLDDVDITVNDEDYFVITIYTK